MININIVKLLIAGLFFLVMSSCGKDNNKEGLSSKKYCDEKLPLFYLKNDNKEDITSVCSCIWNSFPKNGWERKVSTKLYNGEDIGWKIKSFSGIFELKLKKCKEKLNIID